MNFTWKGTSTNSIIPTNSRPYTNNDPNLKTLPRTSFKANPIKHWRKQLQPVYSTKSIHLLQVGVQESQRKNTQSFATSQLRVGVAIDPRIWRMLDSRCKGANKSKAMSYGLPMPDSYHGAAS